MVAQIRPKRRTISRPYKNATRLLMRERNAPDITGWSIEYLLWNAAGTIITTKTVGTGIEITDATHYRVDLRTTAAVKNLAVGTYQYLIRRTDVGGEADMAFGPWRVTRSVPLPIVP